MRPFFRLSRGPTIPELIDAELQEWVVGLPQDLAYLSLHCRMRACLSTAGFVLCVARVLIKLRLIEPAVAAKAFRLASRFSNVGLTYWAACHGARIRRQT
jgi:hypothetical protein